MIKGTTNTGNVGVGWTKPNGNISIKLNSFVVLPANPELVLTLFPNRDNYPGPGPGPSPSPREKQEEEDDDYDIPF